MPVGGRGPDLTTPRMLELNRQMEDAIIASMKRYLEAAATQLRGDGITASNALVERSPCDALID